MDYSDRIPLQLKNAAMSNYSQGRFWAIQGYAWGALVKGGGEMEEGENGRDGAKGK